MSPLRRATESCVSRSAAAFFGRLPAFTTAATALLLIGCTRSATLKMQDGSTVEGKILENDKGTLVLEEFDGRLRRVEAKRVRDIDHPGDTAMVVGASLAAGGTVLVIALMPSDKSACSRETDSNFGGAIGCAAGEAAGKGVVELFAISVGVLTIPPGLGMLFWGNWANSESKDSAEPKPSVTITPAATGAGLAVHATF